MLLVIHILAGLTAIAAGYVALFTVKGAGLHRRGGLVFVYTMCTMALLGAGLALAHSRSPEANVPVGLLTTYLVITGLTAVRPSSAVSRHRDAGLAALAMSVGVILFAFGARATTLPKAQLNSIPAIPFFIFGTVAVLASIGDLRLIRSGGTQLLRGTPRLVRHLWRMCFAHLIAAFSFFLGQAKVIPKPYRIPPLLLIPPLVVLVSLLYWLWRVKFRRSMRGIELGQRTRTLRPTATVSATAK